MERKIFIDIKIHFYYMSIVALSYDMNSDPETMDFSIVAENLMEVIIVTFFSNV